MWRELRLSSAKPYETINTAKQNRKTHQVPHMFPNCVHLFPSYFSVIFRGQSNVQWPASLKCFVGLPNAGKFDACPKSRKTIQSSSFHLVLNQAGEQKIPEVQNDPNIPRGQAIRGGRWFPPKTHIQQWLSCHCSDGVRGVLICIGIRNTNIWMARGQFLDKNQEQLACWKIVLDFHNTPCLCTSIHPAITRSTEQAITEQRNEYETVVICSLVWKYQCNVVVNAWFLNLVSLKTSRFSCQTVIEHMHWFFAHFPAASKQQTWFTQIPHWGVVICAKSSDALMANSESACALRVDV